MDGLVDWRPIVGSGADSEAPEGHRLQSARPIFGLDLGPVCDDPRLLANE